MKHVLLLLILLASSAVWAGETDLLANLPPDPGAAGKATLAGIDSDNDGVRDDVQRWIALTYPNSQKTRAALTQMAKAKQKILLNAADAINARSYAIESNRAYLCLSFVRRQIKGLSGKDSYNISGEMRALYLNTYARSKAALQHSQHLSGQFFSLPPDKSTGCDFNPDAMPN